MDCRLNKSDWSMSNHLTEIENFVTNHQGKSLNPAELAVIFSLYGSFRSTFTDPTSNLESLNWVLHYIIEEAYKSKVEDSAFVVDLIHSLVENEGNICFLFPTFSDAPNLTPTSETLLEYMLYHASRRRALFVGYRLVCLPGLNNNFCFSPVEMALMLKSPILVHLLLRYGAVYSYLEGYGERVRNQWTLQALPCPSIRLCSDILTYFVHFFKKHNPEMKMLSDLDEENSSKCKLLIACERLVLKDTPRLKFQFLLSSAGLPFPDEAAMSLLKDVETFLPGILDYFVRPLSLKHSSKLVIRKALNYNWQLPFGISQLQLPEGLKNYLNLNDE